MISEGGDVTPPTVEWPAVCICGRYIPCRHEDDDNHGWGSYFPLPYAHQAFMRGVYAAQTAEGAQHDRA